MQLLERSTRWVDDVGVWFRDLPDVLRLSIAGLAFPVVVVWWLVFRWRRALFGDAVPTDADAPSADLARKIWLTDKLSR